MTEEIKLFLVEGKDSSSFLSRMVNYGDDYGERYSFTEHIVAASPQEAIDKIWNKMEGRCNDYISRARAIKEEVEELEAAGKHREAGVRAERGFGPLGEVSPIQPRKPEDREDWRATVVKVEGHDIKVEPKAE